MKKKRIFLLATMLVFTCFIYAQRIDKQEVFVATSEEEMYRIYNQMLDSARLSNYFLSPNAMIDRFGFGIRYEIDSRDTIMKIIQRCSWKRSDKYICDRFYRGYISNSMPIDFYERFLDYLEKNNTIENYYIKDDIIHLLHPIKRIIIKKYESENIDKQDSVKALRLIERTILGLINEEHNYRVVLYGDDKYMTKNIRQALVQVIENPYYPAEYLNFYMSQQDTACLDTTGIPPNIKLPRRKEQFTPEEFETYKKELSLYGRLQDFLWYEQMGREEYGGLSAGQAYLRQKQDNFREKGYLPINVIAEYAYNKQDKLLIKHLKEFKKNHPDYPLKYF